MVVEDVWPGCHGARAADADGADAAKTGAIGGVVRDGGSDAAEAVGA